MKLYRTLTTLVLVLASVCECAVVRAETPPWWNDGAEQSSQSANNRTEADRRSSIAASGPVLEEYPLPNESVETLEQRAREQAASAVPSPSPTVDETGLRYLVQPGDVLLVSVWHEPELTREVRVSPDGRINYPLAGELLVEGITIETLRTTLEEKLHRYINEAVVDVSVKEPAGNRVYVLGKVNRPGVYPFTKNIDVVQALSLAGGTAKFASVNDIRILRRVDGQQQAYTFRYSDVERGRSLDQNIVLRSGDVVVVP